MKKIFNLKDYEYHVNIDVNLLVVYERKVTAKECVYRMFDLYFHDRTVTWARNEPWTVVLDEQGNIGKSHCSPDDKFDVHTGLAIAYARVKGLPVHPYFVR